MCISLQTNYVVFIMTSIHKFARNVTLTVMGDFIIHVYNVFARTLLVFKKYISDSFVY